MIKRGQTMEIKIEIIPKEDTIPNKDEWIRYKEEIRREKQEAIYKREKEILERLELMDTDAKNVEKFMCPICNNQIPMSEYLSTVFPDDKYAEWAANLVTHYRHYHIKYYDASWQNSRYGDKNLEYRYSDNHEDYKEIVNNRAKRQLIRKIVKNFQKDVAIPLVCGFLKLQSNDEKTIELIEKHIRVIYKYL